MLNKFQNTYTVYSNKKEHKKLKTLSSNANLIRKKDNNVHPHEITKQH